MSRARTCLLVALLAAPSACRPESSSEDTAEARAAIIGGAPTTGDPGVLLIASYPADLSTFDTCTATLIAPDVVLTAAHCLDAVAHPGEKHGVFVGPDASAYPTASTIIPHLVAITEVHLHPDYDRKPPFHADIAVAKLASPVAVTPMVLSRVAPAPSDVSTPAHIVGFGETKYGQENLAKYAADTVIAAIDADDTVTVGDVMHKSCIGDSGGPAIVNRDGVDTVIGVDSYTDLQGCLEPAHYRRTDLYTDFIDTFVPPPPDPATTSATTSSSGAGGAASGAGGASGTGDDAGGCAVASGAASGSGAPLLALLLGAWIVRASTRRAARRPSRALPPGP